MLLNHLGEARAKQGEPRLEEPTSAKCSSAKTLRFTWGSVTLRVQIEYFFWLLGGPRYRGPGRPDLEPGRLKILQMDRNSSTLLIDVR